MTAEEPLHAFRRLVETWIDCVVAGDLAGAASLLTPELTSPPFEFPDSLIRESIYHYIRTEQHYFEGEHPEYKDLEIDLRELPLTPRSELPPPDEYDDSIEIFEDGTLVGCHPIPIHGRWSGLDAHFLGEVRGGEVKAYLRQLKAS